MDDADIEGYLNQAQDYHKKNDTEKEANQYFFAAKDCYDSGDNEKAITYYNKALELFNLSNHPLSIICEQMLKEIRQEKI